MIRISQDNIIYFVLSFRYIYIQQLHQQMWNKLKSFFSMTSSTENTNNTSNSYSQSNYQQSSSANVTLLRAAQKNKKVVAVIATFVSGTTYDNLFTSVQQKAQEGTQVLVYACSSQSVKAISSAFQHQSANEALRTMVNHIKGLDPDCVVFNWECSSGYSNKNFGEGKDHVMKFAKKMIDRGHMVMFSDFSLKALINNWDSHLLGPNPFVQVSQYGGDFKLEFVPEKLRDCPSAQLQIIGDMAAEGHCNVHAMGGTIVYGVDHKKADTGEYKLQVLTVVTSLNSGQLSEIDGKKGQAGHVLLTYKSGGHLLTSMGHWIELMKVDTSQKVLFEVAARQFGAERAQKMQMEYCNLSNQVQKKQYISKNAVQFIQSQAPCSNMAKKARKMF